MVEAFPKLPLANILVIESNPVEDRIYAGSRDGVIQSFENDPEVSTTEPFMDLSDRVAVIWDGGLLGVAFHPEFGQPDSVHGRSLYAYYTTHCPTRLDGARAAVDMEGCEPGYTRDYPDGMGFFGVWMRLSRFEAYWDEDAGVYRGDPDSEEPLFNIRAYNTHRGGGPVFGKDGHLYVAIGDQRRRTNAQDIRSNFEGGTVRLDVNVVGGEGGAWSCEGGSHHAQRVMQDVTGNADEVSGSLYCVPDDNPWVASGGELFEEFWAVGQRNPHRITVDPVTGDIWSGEVGSKKREEVNVLRGGNNYQWPYHEGTVEETEFKRFPPPDGPLLGEPAPPLAELSREDADCIIGGHVYRGQRHPELYGKYIAGDNIRDTVWLIDPDSERESATVTPFAAMPSGGLATIGVDPDGELLFSRITREPGLFRLSPPTAVEHAPRLLSETGVFRDTAALEVHESAFAYEVHPFWSDGAVKSRWLFLPRGDDIDGKDPTIGFSALDNWSFPPGTVVVKHFEIALDASIPEQRVRLETRLLVMGADGVLYGLTYRWREDQRDAVLLDLAEEEVLSLKDASGEHRAMEWRYPDRTACLRCHTEGSGGFLGLRTHQMNRPSHEGHPGEDQLSLLGEWGAFDAAWEPEALADLPRTVSLDDVRAPLDARARSWLDTNCSGCHRPGEGGRALLDLRLTTPLSETMLLRGAVATKTLNAGLDLVVAPARPERSILIHRVRAEGGSAILMPPLGRETVDQEAVELLLHWIESLSSGASSAPVRLEYYTLDAPQTLPDFDGLTPDEVLYVPEIAFSGVERRVGFGARYTGALIVPRTGAWSFCTNSDDGSRLTLDGNLVVDNGGRHAATERCGEVTLKPGVHELEVLFFQGPGSLSLEVTWEGPGVAKGRIPSDAFRRAGASAEPLRLAAIPTQRSRPGDDILLHLGADGLGGERPYFDAAGLPEGLRVDHAHGVISGRVGEVQRGSHEVTVSVSDGPNVDVRTFVWKIGR